MADFCGWVFLEAISTEFSLGTVLLASGGLCAAGRAFCTDFTIHFHPLGNGGLFFISGFFFCVSTLPCLAVFLKPFSGFFIFDYT